MDLQPIIVEICDAADVFLAGVTKRDQARAGIAEFLTIRHATLNPAERTDITDQVMHVLEAEDFFSRDPGSGPDQPAG